VAGGEGLLDAVLTEVPEFAVESYLLVRGQRGPGSGPYNWEDDLFAGLVGRPVADSG
jgi:N-acetyl-1-D-myo-inositol-2-amino-2-deoxy-alpha-D-glucopyranoside deacetylase